MKSIYLTILIAFFSFPAFAQKGTTQIGVGADMGLPTHTFNEDHKTGFGGYAKALFGVGTADQVTFTSGYTYYKGTWREHLSNVYIIPFLAGYRHNFRDFYVEPQVGYGIYGRRFTEFNGFAWSEPVRASTGIFTWAIGAGYTMKQFEIGARFQSSEKKSYSATSLVGIHLGYNFSLRKK